MLQRLYQLENSGLAGVALGGSRPGDAHDRPPQRFCTLAGVGRREARAVLAERFKGQLRFAPGGGVG